MNTSSIGKSQKQKTNTDSNFIKLSASVLEKLKFYQQQWETDTIEEVLDRLVEIIEDDFSPQFISNDKKSENWQIWLGIDPGLASVGWAVMEEDVDNLDLPVLLDYGTISTTKKRPTSERLYELEQDLTLLFIEFQPTNVALEIPFIGENQNPNTTRNVLAAIGVIELCCYKKIGIFPVHLYPSMWKAHLGNGRADADEVRDIVSTLFDLGELKKARLEAVAIAYAGFCGVKLDND